MIEVSISGHYKLAYKNRDTWFTRCTPTFRERGEFDQNTWDDAQKHSGI